MKFFIPLALLAATSATAFVSPNLNVTPKHKSFIIPSKATTLSSSSTDNDKGTESSSTEKKEPTHAPRHDTGTPQEVSPEEMKVQAAFAEHQQNCPKPDFATDVRTLIQYNHGFAVMSTNSKVMDGYPNGSVVGFAPDEDGNPLFVFSGMSSHTQDVLKDPRCSLTVASKQFKGAADGRVNLMGKVALLPKEEKEAATATYMKKHPGAFWITFGDFNWFKMEIERISFVGGFARAGTVSPKEYKAAKPDAISEFGPHIAAHMNDDHMDSTIGMIESQVPGLNASEAVITSVDSLGMYVKVTRSPSDSEEIQQFKMRLPFPREAKDRKDVKDVIVEMTRAAAAASAAEE